MYRTRPRPLAISHRGLRTNAPENSMPAFLAAHAAGAEAIELDVHATSDGVLYVHHDPLPHGARTSGANAPGSFRDLDSHDVDSLELSPGVPIPRLDDVILELGARVELMIEVKARGIEHELAACLRRHVDAIDHLAVHSFDHRISRAMVSLFPSLRAGILQNSYAVDSCALLRTSGAMDLWQNVEFIDELLVNDVRSCGGRVIAWTANETWQWDALDAAGVHGICTDKIDLLVAHSFTWGSHVLPAATGRV